MCGIVGYIGPRQAAGLLVEGLRRLEYRGYDSAGVAVVNGNGLEMREGGRQARQPGAGAAAGPAARHHWASGTRAGPRTARPTTPNAHPHTDQSGRIALVHNGIIENAGAIKKMLDGPRAHLPLRDRHRGAGAPRGRVVRTGNLEEAVATALRDVDGTYGIAVISADEPDTLVAARKGSPLLVGVGDGEYFVASDASALRASTRARWSTSTTARWPCSRATATASATSTTRADRQADQPDRVGPRHDRARRLRPLHAEGDLRAARERARTRCAATCSTTRARRACRASTSPTSDWQQIDRIIITACGTSWHAGLIGEYMLEELARIPIEVEYASEFRYRNPVVDKTHAGDRHPPVGRDGRHAGGDARGEAARRAGRWAS